jgi:thymidylate synthase (FAD)
MSTQKGFQGWGGGYCMTCWDNDLLSHVDKLYVSKEALFQGTLCKTCKGTGKTPGDEKLLKYLYEHKHMTPFEMAGAVFEIKAPIFVFREWHRHRTQSYNEMSARYTPLPNENYLPTLDRLMHGRVESKQSGTIPGAASLTGLGAEDFQQRLAQSYGNAQILYEQALAAGVPKELARLCLPVGRYSKMRAQANLRNWLQFLTLRADKDAQWEIRQYAEAVASILDKLFPRTMELWGASR